MTTFNNNVQWKWQHMYKPTRIMTKEIIHPWQHVYMGTKSIPRNSISNSTIVNWYCTMKILCLYKLTPVPSSADQPSLCHWKHLTLHCCPADSSEVHKPQASSEAHKPQARSPHKSSSYTVLFTLQIKPYQNLLSCYFSSYSTWRPTLQQPTNMKRWN